jgi:hypothetical protein
MTGLTLGQVGIPYNLGRERVRQILKATGGDPIKEASKAGVKVGESSSSSLRRKVR